ncbi:uncharacterized protein LOC128198903 [Bicyclus anynana]|uniref:Uncharacterized protein LOC128198903 n=1 Tax=Bicyclus anynana TaxID=110368 RepID=A0ABM3LTT1_BICAN|nr:uncharacterized protein LOC128198903 [Bicyclus anynana]
MIALYKKRCESDINHFCYFQLKCQEHQKPVSMSTVSGNPFDSDNESGSVKKSKVKKTIKKPPRAEKPAQKQKKALQSDSDSEPEQSKIIKKRRQILDSEEENEPIRASALRSYFSRRVGTGYTLQRADPTKTGEYYIELRVYNAREAETQGADRWKRALITCKSAVEGDSATWRAVTKLVTAVKEEYSPVQPILYPYNVF